MDPPGVSFDVSTLSEAPTSSPPCEMVARVRRSLSQDVRYAARCARPCRATLRGGRAGFCGEEGLGGVRGEVADHAPTLVLSERKLAGP
jgi:hypothetical protein